MKNIFITGESGTIPLAIQKQLLNNENYNVINSQLQDSFNLKRFKKHKSFEIREPELDFTDRELLFSKPMQYIWEQTDIIIHSGAFVGTDYCDAYPNEAIKVNVEGTKNIVDICNNFNIKLVYFSTTAIFDTSDYSKYKLMTEETKIKPTTLYGITKYSGEQIVERLCKTDKIIIRPVFGFGDYPDDLHSALTKVIYTLAYNMKYENKINLDVLLDKQIEKTYTRVENIANIVLKIIDLNLWNDVFNVGDNYTSSKIWPLMINQIYKCLSENILPENLRFYNSVKESEKYIKFHKEKDYLHWHNISTVKLERCGILQDLNLINLSNGIEMTVDSVLKNLNIKPYWI